MIKVAREILDKVLPVNRYCSRCNTRVNRSDVTGYPYVCYSCDENLFKIETYKK